MLLELSSTRSILVDKSIFAYKYENDMVKNDIEIIFPCGAKSIEKVYSQTKLSFI